MATPIHDLLTAANTAATAIDTKENISVYSTHLSTVHDTVIKQTAAIKALIALLTPMVAIAEP